MNTVILNNPNQSALRNNILRIAGINTANQKIVAQNQDRIFGGYNAVFFNGNSAGSETTGTGGSNDNPNGVNGDPTKPDYPAIPPFNPAECEVKSIDDFDTFSGGMELCSLGGFDCETGEFKTLQIGGNGQGATDDCEECNPEKYRCTVGKANIYLYDYQTQKSIFEDRNFLCTIDECKAKVKELKEQAKALVQQYAAQYGVACSIQETETIPVENISDCTGQFRIYYDVRCRSQGIYARVAVNDWLCCDLTDEELCRYADEKAEKSKNQYLKDGLIYTGCDDAGVECTEMCDSIGNNYIICVNDDGGVDITRNDGTKKSVNNNGVVQ